jgi:L-aspartate oxidase
LHAELLVVGSGAAGLAAAIEAAERGARVLLVTGGALLSGSSPRAQGGVAAAIGRDDNVGLHYADTMAVGAGLNDRTAVQVLVREGVEIARELVRDGAPFTSDEAGPDLGLEAGHSRRRILHAGGGATGLWLTRFLAERAARFPNISIIERTQLAGLTVRQGQVVGATLEDPNGGRILAEAQAVLLATGGAGALWGRTTNAPETRGVGIGLAWLAGATLADLEMMQFHPTALVLPGRPAFLLSEALRGEGALLVDAAERPFVDPLLPRDVVARAVAGQAEELGGAYLTMRHLDPDAIHGAFPSLSRQLSEWGLDLARDLLPIAPAAHYLMGGVRTDADGRTDLPGLYAAGEVACTGAQGANRLASNSILECLVFGRRAARAALGEDAAPAVEWTRIAAPFDFGAWPSQSRDTEPSPIGSVLDRCVGVTRNADGLRAAIAALPDPEHPATPPDLRVAGFAARAAYLREESRGAQSRSDYPATDPRWRGRILWRRGAGPAFEGVMEEQNDDAN